MFQMLHCDSQERILGKIIDKLGIIGKLSTNYFWRLRFTAEKGRHSEWQHDLFFQSLYECSVLLWMRILLKWNVSFWRRKFFFFSFWIDGTDDSEMIFLFFEPFALFLGSFTGPLLDLFFLLDSSSFGDIVDNKTFLIFHLYLFFDGLSIGDSYFLNES